MPFCLYWVQSRMTTKMISVIIPHFEKTELTNQLVLSLRKYCGKEPEILVFDDGSKVPYQNPSIVVCRVNENMGFLFASRAGLVVAKGDIKILMNNDVLVTGDFIPLVEKQIRSSPLSLVGNTLLSTIQAGTRSMVRCFPIWRVISSPPPKRYGMTYLSIPDLPRMTSRTWIYRLRLTRWVIQYLH